MSDLTLPGTIPGLLQEGAPVKCVCHGYHDFICRINAVGVGIAVLGGLEPQTHRYALDLSKRVGRWCAVRWLDDRPIATLREAAPCGPVMLGEILDTARRGRDMDHDRIGHLRDLVLRLAGVDRG